VVLGKARRSKVPAELLDVVGGGAEEVDCLEVRHRLLGAGGVVYRLDEEHLLPQQIRLAVHHAHHPDLEEAGGHGSGQIGIGEHMELRFTKGRDHVRFPGRGRGSSSPGCRAACGRCSRG
jgi:hypothetical protein